MKRIVFTAFVWLWVSASSLAAASEDAAIGALQAETESLFKPGRDLADVKLSIDQMVDPTVNVQAGLVAVDRMVGEALAMTGEATGSAERLAALKRYVYEAGH